MRKTMMVSVAVAALFAATGFATAQGVNQGGVKESPAAASPKGDTAVPTNAPVAKGAETAAPGAASKEGTPQHAQGKPDAKTTSEMKPDSKSKASDSTTPTTTSKDMKTPTAETKSTSEGKTAAEMKPDSKAKASDSATTKDLKTPTAETRPSAFDSKTTGSAATSATAAPPVEKRGQIATAIKQEKVEETTVTFNVSVGTAVPNSVRYYPLPSHIVEIYPEWRGYDFILVHGKYVILRPHTHEIVYIIEG
jgi:Protein of unknown function (DUF1236)